MLHEYTERNIVDMLGHCQVTRSCSHGVISLCFALIFNLCLHRPPCRALKEMKYRNILGVSEGYTQIRLE